MIAELGDDTTTRYRQASNVVSRTIAGETILVPIRGRLADLRRIYMLEGSGEVMWESLRKPVSIAELVAGVEAAYEVDHDTAARDAAAFLEDLNAAQLVEKED